MAEKTDAYVDTGAFIAFLDRSDTHHPLFKGLFSKPPRLVTTPLVIAEGHAWFLKRYDRTRALQFMAMIEDLAPLKVTDIGLDEQAAAVRLLRKFSDQSLTLADALGLHIMQAQRITRCWAADRHLTLMGATLAIDQY